MYYHRLLENQIIQSLQPQKAVIVYGARQTGKTTLVKSILKKINQPHIFVNADIEKYRTA